MSEYQFTKDWFNWAPAVWQQLIPMLPSEAGDRAFLEIGSFEGRSAVWLIENIMVSGDWIDCVDTWEGGEEHGDEDMPAVEARFDHNIAKALGGCDTKERPRHTRYASLADTEDERKRVYKYKTTSTDMLAQKLSFQLHGFKPEAIPIYDFVYIDGSHIAKDVLTDACMAWPLLKPNGIMVFDDYMWGNPRDILHRPKPAIDAFANIFAEHIDIVHVGYQFVCRRK